MNKVISIPKYVLLPLFSMAFLCGTVIAKPLISPVGEYVLPAKAPEGLSGITWLSGNNYALIEDSGGIVHYMKIFAEGDSGTVTNVVFAGRRKVNGIIDGEGIAFDKKGKRLFISDESGPKIAIVDYKCESVPSWLALPTEFKQMRENKALEALSYDGNLKTLWTAAEDAMLCDGDISSAENEAVTRIYAFDMSVTNSPVPVMYRYKLDKAFGHKSEQVPMPSPFSGLVAMSAISANTLLVLERSCGIVGKEDGLDGEGLITSSLFVVDPSASKPGEIMEKELLWRHVSTMSNYEGMTLGPRLADGSRLLLLVADGDKSVSGRLTFQWAKALYALRIDNAE